jgi:hypothetical protein
VLRFLIVQINFTGAQIEGLALGVRPAFAEAYLAVGDKSNLASSGGFNEAD